MIELCKTADVMDGFGLKVVVPGFEPIAVLRDGDNFYVIDDRCSHGDASLADGEIENGTVICPFHFGSFDLRTGEAVEAPCVKPVRTHKFKVLDGAIYLAADAE